MSRHNRPRRLLTACFDTLRGGACGMAAGAAALLVLGTAGLMEAASATAAYALVLSIGGLLLIGVAAVARGAQEPRKLPVESRRAHVRPRPPR